MYRFKGVTSSGSDGRKAAQKARNVQAHEERQLQSKAERIRYAIRRVSGKLDGTIPIKCGSKTLAQVRAKLEKDHRQLTDALTRELLSETSN